MNAVAVLRHNLAARYQPGIWTIILVVFLNSAAFSIGLPFLALYLSTQRGLATSWIGLIMLIGVAVPSVPQLLGGSLADRLGRRPLLLLTAGAAIFSFIALALAVGYTAPVWLIAVLYTLTRSAIVMQRPGLYAAIIDLTPREKLTEAIALSRISGNLGWAAGPAIGGFLTTYLSYPWLFGSSTLITLVTLTIIIFLVKESGTPSGENVPFSHILAAGKDRNLLVMTLLSILVCMIIVQLAATLSIYTVETAGFTTAQYGFLLTLNGLLVAGLQFPVTRRLARCNDSVSLVLGAFLFGAGYLLMAWVGNYSLALAAIGVLTAGEILFSPTSAAVVGKMAPDGWRGRYMAFYGSSETVGMGTGLYLGGFLLEALAGHPLGIWGTIAAFGFAAALGFAVFRVDKRVK